MEDKKECIKRWEEMDKINELKELRRKLIEDWLPTSNQWDPVTQKNEKFVIEDIRDFKKVGRKQMFLVEYEPRILEADEEYPMEMPEVRGLPWMMEDWLSATELRRRIDKEDAYLKRRIEEVKLAVGAGVGIVEEAGVGGNPEG